jgi:hypothetical protein
MYRRPPGIPSAQCPAPFDFFFLDIKILDSYTLQLKILGLERQSREGSMTVTYSDPVELKILIESRIEQLRGGPVRRVNRRLPRRN